MEKEQFIGTRREFLNKDYLTSLTAMIGYSIKMQTWHDELIKEGLFDNVDINFNITSCIKKLDLDFSIKTKEDMRNSLHKLDTIISVCENMKEDLKKARLLINEGIKRRKELDNKKPDLGNWRR